ncbi:hypothetical protein LXL04_029946 [Taraxacum kok-saghyz]
MGFATDVFSPNNVGGSNTEKSSKKGLKLKPAQMKGNKRESTGSKMFRNFMAEQNSNQKRTIEILEMDASPVNQSQDVSIIDAVSLINNMVVDGIMTKGSDLWCFAMTLFEDAVKRELFISLPDDADTISRAFHEVLEAITARRKGFQGLARDIIRPKDSTFPSIPLQIKEDKRYMPYFKDCIGCIHGTHILACIPENEQLRYIGRKSVQTQIDVIMAAFALHNYVRGNSEEETDYDLAEEDPDCIPADYEPRDVRDSDTSNANLYEGSNDMKGVFGGELLRAFGSL